MGPFYRGTINVGPFYRGTILSWDNFIVGIINVGPFYRGTINVGPFYRGTIMVLVFYNPSKISFSMDFERNDIKDSKLSLVMQKFGNTLIKFSRKLPRAAQHRDILTIFLKSTVEASQPRYSYM